MKRLSLRLSPSLDLQVRTLAARENISINQFISLALAEKISALVTEEYLGVHTNRASKAKFRRALAKVANVEPADQDRL